MKPRCYKRIIQSQYGSTYFFHEILYFARGSCSWLVFFYPYAATDDNTYSWQPVLQNMRVRDGDYQILISNEGVCKTRCVENQDCIGVDWDAGRRSCFLLSGSGASPYSANGYRHWRITRNRSTPTINHNNTYSWQPVQQNMRLRNGDYQIGISNEEVCKTRCVADQNCIGVDWDAGRRSCFLLSDSGASPYSANGYRHWRIIRSRSTSIFNQDLVPRHEAQLHPTRPASVHCSSPENWITVMSVLLGIATLVVAGLMCNTWRLQQKIRSCTCDLKKANFLHQDQANGYQSYDGPTNQPTVYTDIAITLPPIPTDNEIVYADIDDFIRI